MKQSIVILLFAALGFLWCAPNSFADEYEDGQANPLRMLAYLVNPIGVALEWTIARPLHALADANKATRYIFGHKLHSDIFAEDPVEALRRERARNLQIAKQEEQKREKTSQP